MADRNIGFFFRFAGIVFVISIICIFITAPGSAEFFATLFSLITSLAVLVICAIMLNRKK